MLTVNDFIAKFDKYSDSELIEIENNFEGYSDEAKEAFQYVIDKRGGVDVIRNNVIASQSVKQEEQRIINESTSFFRQKIDVDFVQNTTKSDMLDRSTVDQLIETAYLKFANEQRDTNLSGKTLVLIILGGLIGSLVGGVVMGYFAHNGKVMYILIGAVFLINYGIIKLISKKSFRNHAVAIASIIATLASFFYQDGFMSYLEVSDANFAQQKY